MIFCAYADVTRKRGIKDIGKDLVAPVQPERGTKCSRRRSRKQRRSCTGDKFIRPAAERVKSPARQPVRCRCAPDVGCHISPDMRRHMARDRYFRRGPDRSGPYSRPWKESGRHRDRQARTRRRARQHEKSRFRGSGRRRFRPIWFFAIGHPNGKQSGIIYCIGRPRTLDISQDRPHRPDYWYAAMRTLPGRKGEQ